MRPSDLLCVCVCECCYALQFIVIVLIPCECAANYFSPAFCLILSRLYILYSNRSNAWTILRSKNCCSKFERSFNEHNLFMKHPRTWRNEVFTLKCCIISHCCHFEWEKFVHFCLNCYMFCCESFCHNVNAGDVPEFHRFCWKCKQQSRLLVFGIFYWWY